MRKPVRKLEESNDSRFMIIDDKIIFIDDQYCNCLMMSLLCQSLLTTIAIFQLPFTLLAVW